MLTLLVLIFVAVYTAIALEHPLGVHKSATALIGAGLLWTVYATMGGHAEVSAQLGETVGATAQIVFFLLGAMTIVEVVDAHNGFEVITARIHTRSLTSLLWLVGWVSFFLSSVLDNMTTTIVMVSLMKRLLANRDDRLLFAGIIVIAANAGGAWTPIGDVTTTMLWIGGQITTVEIMKGVLLPSLANLLVPLLILSVGLRGRAVEAPDGADAGRRDTRRFEKNLMLFLGLGTLMFVPVFKALTHLPPFLGILFGLGVLWLVSELLHRGKVEEEKHSLTLVHALTRIDMGSVVFFIGILLAVACLEHTHLLADLAHRLDQSVGREDVIVILIGLASAVIDNVPLVAASMGMYSLEAHPTDSFLWEFMAYCAGTGGSILIIGSAAGVAAMGIEKIDFLWYARKIGWLAALGYFAGVAVYLVQHHAG